ncbi:MAG: TetR/AcrR family transcriptional regulator [Gordonia sp. (in: high G+C Gram-positive bacteria)]
MMSQQLKSDGELPAKRIAANAIDDDVIVDAATKLMTTIGIRRTTMADVARTAGVSRATLYRKFANVNEIAAAVTTREFSAIVTSAAAQNAEPGLPSIVGMLVHIVSEIRRHPLLRRIVELDPEFLIPYLLHRTGQTSRGQLAVISTTITHGQADGAIRAGDPDKMAATVLQMAWSFALTGPVFVTGPDADAILDSELTDLLERYLRP